jgi:hypothetical protein
MAISIQQPRHRTVTHDLLDPVDDAREVCPRCYRRVHDTFTAQAIVREERDYTLLGQRDRCYLNFRSANPDKTAEPTNYVEDRVERTEKGVFCRWCGASIHDRDPTTLMSVEEATERAQEIADIYESNGVTVERDTLIREVRRLKQDSSQTGREHELFREALREAIE